MNKNHSFLRSFVHKEHIMKKQPQEIEPQGNRTLHRMDETGIQAHIALVGKVEKYEPTPCITELLGVKHEVLYEVYDILGGKPIKIKYKSGKKGETM